MHDAYKPLTNFYDTDKNPSVCLSTSFLTVLITLLFLNLLILDLPKIKAMSFVTRKFLSESFFSVLLFYTWHLYYWSIYRGFLLKILPIATVYIPVKITAQTMNNIYCASTSFMHVQTPTLVLHQGLNLAMDIFCHNFLADKEHTYKSVIAGAKPPVRVAKVQLHAKSSSLHYWAKYIPLLVKDMMAWTHLFTHNTHIRTCTYMHTNTHTRYTTRENPLCTVTLASCVSVFTSLVATHSYIPVSLVIALVTVRLLVLDRNPSVSVIVVIEDSLMM